MSISRAKMLKRMIYEELIIIGFKTDEKKK